MKLVPSVDRKATFAADDTGASADEVYRFREAYCSIQDPAHQAEVFALLVLYASKSPRYSEVLYRLATKH